MKAGEVIHLDALVEACGFFVSNTDTFGGYGCSHPGQEDRDPDTGEGQCLHCPLAWRLCPTQEKEDAALMVKAGLDPDDGEERWLCLNVDVHDTEGLTQGGRVWWRVPGHPELESCLTGPLFEPRHKVRLASDRARCVEGVTLGAALLELKPEAKEA